MAGRRLALIVATDEYRDPGLKKLRAPGTDANGTNAGGAYVVFGHSDGFAATLDLGALDGTDGFRIDGVAAGDFAGFSVAGAGVAAGALSVLGAEADLSASAAFLYDSLR